MNARRILLLIGLLGVMLFIVIFSDDLVQAWHIIKGVHWSYIFLVIPIQAWSYFSNAQFYQKTLAAIGAPEPPLGRLFGLSLGVTFTDIILPTAGASGVSLLAAVLRRDKISTGQAAFIQLARYATIYISFIFLLLFALGALYFGDGIARIAIRIVVLVTSVIVVFSIVAGYVIYDRRGFDWLISRIQRFVDWVSRRLRKGKELIGKERLAQTLLEFHEGVKQLVKSRDYLKKPFWWGLSGSIAEVTTLYVAFAALGFALNPGIVIIAYAVANIAGAISIIPGDVGIYELVMVSTLSIVGVPLAVGVSATLLYRVANKALLIPIGFYFYNRYIKQATDAAHA